ncbi:MAG: translation elongation factor EF-1 subunit alpha, partial [Thermoplasmata archaeon]
LNVVFIGHVDHGKSTTVGRLLLDTGAIDPRIIEQYRKEAVEKGKATFEFAWVMDRLKEERERGVTIDVAHKEFQSNKYYITIIDAPGHRDFVKNMITGTSQADAAILVVSAKEGVQEQTREHTFLARALGVPQIVVAINKMDATTPPYSQDAYNNVKTEMEKLLKTVGYRDVIFVPISGYVGDNVVKPSPNLPWYKGPTLVEAFDMLKIPEKPIDKPLRIPVQDVYSITGIGTVPVGRVETGVLNVNDTVIFMPANKTGEVKSIEMHHQPLPRAEPGDNIGFNVRGISKNDIKRGDVCGKVDNPPTVVQEFTAQIVVLNHPSVISPGYTPVFHVHTAQVACTISEIVKTLDPRTNATKQEKPDFIKTGDVAIVKVTPTRPLVIEKSSEIPQLGRFAIRDMGITVAAGLCIDLVKKTS